MDVRKKRLAVSSVIVLTTMFVLFSPVSTSLAQDQSLMEGVLTEDESCGSDIDMSGCGIRVRIDRVIRGDQSFLGKEVSVTTSFFSVQLVCQGADLDDSLKVGDRVEILASGQVYDQGVAAGLMACNAGDHVRKLENPTPPPTTTTATLDAECHWGKSGAGVVKFSDASKGQVVSRRWDFGDGKACPADCSSVSGGGQQIPGDERSPVHRYSGAKNYYVATLTVTDSSGRTDSDGCRVILGDPPILIVLDANGNDLIDERELYVAMDHWVSGEPVPFTEDQEQRVIDDKLFFRILDMWMLQTPVSFVVPQSTKSIQKPSVRITALGPSVQTLTVSTGASSMISFDLYGLDGRRLLHEAGAGGRVAIELRDTAGKPLPNGVYFYSIMVRGLDGAVVSKGVKRLIILR